MSKNWAICIGINSYGNLPSLRYAVRDAEAMRDFLLREADFEQVFYFADDAPPIETPNGPMDSAPTFGNLMRFFRVRFEREFLRVGDNLWLFFAGHGMQHEGYDYLIPKDGDPGDVDRTALSVNYITARLQRSGADNTVLLLDACRNQGRRAAAAFGEDEQKGVVTIYSCRPQQFSYEIEALQQGAFTHVLLEGFRLRGANSCATVERINQYLRYQVPALNARYQQPLQTPYVSVEPLSKKCLILLPRRARLEDVEALKNVAFRAENAADWDLAQRMWTRVLAASQVDQDAISAFGRIALKRQQQSVNRSAAASATAESRPIQPPQSTTRSSQSTDSRRIERDVPQVQPARTQTSRATQTSRSGAQIQRMGSPSMQSPFLSKLQRHVGRRQAMKALGFSGGGLGVLLLGRVLLKSITEPEIETPSIAGPLTAAAFTPVQFKTVTVNDKGVTVEEKTIESSVYTESIEGIELDLMPIVGGTFVMGSPDSEAGREDDEGPQHEVSVKPFLMGRYQVTQQQWRTVAALDKVERDLVASPSYFEGEERPVEQISWDDAVEFCQRLSIYSGREYRLPSEAEWEYACRAGTTTPFHFGSTLTADIANYNADFTYSSGPKGNNRRQTVEMGSFPANAFGVYDMHGNLWEWCADDWYDNYKGAPTDGSPRITSGNSSRRLLRSGSWDDVPGNCRSADRGRGAREFRGYTIGFRVVCASAWTLS
ncbi:MAG: SUMF1/EgtB/PvdO family nonheme iron enzyme [Cyanobacteria bacterium P01_D01_bin.1]